MKIFFRWRLLASTGRMAALSGEHRREFMFIIRQTLIPSEEQDRIMMNCRNNLTL